MSHIRCYVEYGIAETASLCEEAGTVERRDSVAPHHIPVNLQERLWSKVQRGTRPDACWLWTGRTTPDGYGQIYLTRERRPGYVHRLSWEIARGPVPAGLSVLHRCDTPRCVNPAHLFLGTQADNMRDAAGKGRLHVSRPRAQRVSPRAVAMIRARVAGGSRQSEVAREFGVSKGYVSQLVRGRARQYDAARADEARPLAVGE